MRDLHLLDKLRIKGRDLPPHFKGYSGDSTCGAFVVNSPIDGAALRCIASSDYGWEHVSVSRTNRCPNWPEMCHIKELFFKDDETVIQLHVPRSDHINEHPNCLHLWRPTHAEIPRPMGWMVGGMTPADADREAKKYDPQTGQIKPA